MAALNMENLTTGEIMLLAGKLRNPAVFAFLWQHNFISPGRLSVLMDGRFFV
jgi:hypothetical protein